MPGPPKIPDVEWNLHKATIQSLYVTENKTLGQMMEYVASQSGFRPSKAQYIRQLKKWGFEKNSSADQWKQVAKVVRKRKHEGKDSEVFIRNDRVSTPKLRKEISRYAVHEESRECSSPRSENLDGVVVQTPKADVMRHTVFLGTPWFDFQNRIEPYFEYLRKLNLGSAAPDPLLHQQAAYTGNDVLSDLPQIFEKGPWAIPDHQGIASYARYTDYNSPNTISFELPDELNVPLLATGETSDEVSALSADFIGATTDSKNTYSGHELLPYLDDIIVEPYQGQLAKNVEQLKGPFELDTVLQLVRSAVYLSSNNLLSDTEVDELVKWMIRSGTQWALEDFFDLKTLTTEIFGSTIFVSAARLGCMDIVRTLIAKTIDVDVLSGYGSRRTALEEAVRNQHPRIVKLLLDEGASLARKNRIPGSLLHDALAGSHSIEIVEMLINKGIDVNDPIMLKKYGCTALVYAAERHDLVMVRMLLGAGANVNEMHDGSITALQASIGEYGLDVALALIDAGASIDAPMGDIFAHAREGLKASCNFDQLTTPIQRAALADNVEFVQCLLSKGADINAWPWEGCKDKIRGLLTAPWCDENPKVAVKYPEVMTVLQAAAFNRNATLIRVVLGAHADVNARGCGDTPLQLAAAKGDAKSCQILLRYGADINAPADARYGRTALQAAAKTGNCELVQQLLRAGADVDAAASPTGGRTALQAAVEHGSIELVKTLIEAGGNIHVAASEKAGRTCLQAAAEYGHVELVQLLLSVGADVNSPAAPGSDGLTALQAAVSPCPLSRSDGTTQVANKELARTRILQILLNAGADVNTPQSADLGETALVAAIREQKIDLAMSDSNNYRHRHALGELIEQRTTERVALLIKAGADVNAYCSTIPLNIHADTPLKVAAERGFVQIATMLLNAGAQVNLQTVGSKFTALHCALRSKRAAMVQFLLEHGADPNACSPDSSPCTPLQIALTEFDTNNEIASALIDAGAHVNRTPCIGLAARAGNLQAVQLLLKAGADVNSRLGDESTALQQAIAKCDADLIKLLIEAGADSNEPNAGISAETVLQQAAANGDIEVVRLLLAHGADINAPAGRHLGKTALQQAAANGDIEVVRLLLAHGADINAPACRIWGRTALQAAAANGNIEVVRLLLAHGADINAPAGCMSGFTALQGAASTGYLKIVLMLLEAGAHVNAPRAEIRGAMALDAAAEQGRLDIVALLLNNDDDAEGIDDRCERAAKFAASNGHRVIARILREHCVNQGSTA
ncbi:hypothetical protein N7G274_010759 [Stereocaulon virgatum]|uniref:Clr5 domain-containing protein n=1 Tax=Stereocaulon virgatum TaxID=373712 RepID=A0ABR3ZTL8_9LECA